MGWMTADLQNMPVNKTVSSSAGKMEMLDFPQLNQIKRNSKPNTHAHQHDYLFSVGRPPCHKLWDPRNFGLLVMIVFLSENTKHSGLGLQLLILFQSVSHIYSSSTGQKTVLNSD